MRLSFLLFFFTFLFTAQSTFAQSCFDEKLRQGRDAYAARQYFRALQFFDLAGICPDARPEELDQWTLKTRDAIAMLLQEVEQERNKAVDQRQLADSLRRRAELMTRLNKNAALALRVNETDPTLALRMAQYAWEKGQDQEGVSVIFREIASQKVAWVKKELRGHLREVWEIRTSPSGEFLATTSEGGTCRIWDTKTWRTITTFSGHNGKPINSVDFSPDKQWVATAGDDGHVRLWQPRSGVESQVQLVIDDDKEHSKDIYRVRFIDSLHLATAGKDGNVRLWNYRTGTELLKLTEHGDEKVNALAISPNKKWMLTGGNDQKVRVWDLTRLLAKDAQGENRSESIRQIDIGANVYDLAFSPDGKHIAVAEVGWFGLYETENWQRKTWIKDLRWEIYAITFSRDGTKLIAGGQEKQAAVWDIQEPEEPKLLFKLKGHEDLIYGVAFSPSGNPITGGEDKSVKLWAKSDDQFMHEFKAEDNILATAVAPAETALLAYGGDDKQITVYDLKTKSNKFVFKEESNSRENRHSGSIKDLAFSPNGKFLASASADNSVGVWDMETGKSIHWFTKSNAQEAVAFSPDGRFLAFGGSDKMVHLFDLQRKEELYSVSVGGGLDELEFSPSGKYLAVPHWGDEVDILELDAKARSLTRVKVLAAHNADANAATYSPDGKWLATGSNDEYIHIWALNNEFPEADQPMHRLKTPQWVKSLSFSQLPNDKFDFPPMLYSIHDDNSLRVWDAERGRELVSFMEHTSLGQVVSTGKNSPVVLTGASDERALVWRDLAHWLKNSSTLLEDYGLAYMTEAGAEYTSQELEEEALHILLEFQAQKSRSLAQSYELTKLNTLLEQRGTSLDLKYFLAYGQAEDHRVFAEYFYDKATKFKADTLLEAANLNFGKAKELYNRALKDPGGYTYENLKGLANLMEEEGRELPFSYFEALKGSEREKAAAYYFSEAERLNSDNLQQYARGQEFAEKAIDLNPKVASYHLELGRAYFNLGQGEKAKAAFSAAIQHNESYDLAYWWRAHNAKNLLKDTGESTFQDYAKASKLYYSVGNNDNALQTAQSALQLKPTDTEMLNNAGYAAFYKKDYTECQKQLRKYIEVVGQKDTPADVLYHLARASYEQKEYEDAIPLFTQAIEKEKTYNNLYYRGLSYNNAEKYESALKDFVAAVALQPNNAFAHYYKAEAARKLKNYNTALEGYNASIQIGSSDVHYDYYYRAEVNEALGRYRNAVNDFAEVMQRKKDFKDTEARYKNLRETHFRDEVFAENFERGKIYFQDENYEGAKTSLAEAVRLDSNSYDAYTLYARTLYLQEIYDVSASAYETVKSIHPKRFSAVESGRMAMAHYRNKNYKAALLAFEEALKKEKDNVEWQYFAGQSAYNAEQYERGIHFFNKALALDADYNYPDYFKAQCFLKLNRYPEAVMSFTEGIYKKPNSDLKYDYTHRGRAYLGMKNYTAAITDFETALELAPNYTYAQGFLQTATDLQNPEAATARYRVEAQKAQENENHSEGITANESILRIAPKDEEAQYYLGYHQQKSGAHQEAVETFGKLLAQNPSKLKGEAYYYQGKAFIDLENYSSAVEAFTNALKYKPDPNWQNWSYALRGKAYRGLEEYEKALADYRACNAIEPVSSEYTTYYVALCLQQLGRYEEAVEAWAVSINDKSTGYKQYDYRERGLCYLALEKYEKALADFQKSDEISPGFSDVREKMKETLAKLPKEKQVAFHWKRGKEQLKNKSYSDAQESFKKLITLVPTDSAYFYAGKSYEGNKSYADAAAYYQEAAKLDSANAEYPYRAAFSFYSNKEYAKAVDYFKIVEKLRPQGYGYTWYYSALCLKRMENYSEAITYYTKSINSGAADLQYDHRDRGDCYVKLGKFAQAIKDYEKSLELSPGFTGVEEKLKQAKARLAEKKNG